jgi:arginine/ornithine transport system permease protein
MNMDEFMTQLAGFFGGSSDTRLFSTTDGLLLTLALQVIPMAIGLACSIPLAFARNARSRWIANGVWFYTYLFRGTPMLVQLFLIYYGLAQFDVVRNSWAWDYLRDPYFCALLSFTLNTTAYTTEILAGQIRRIDSREIEAAQSLGMSRWQMNYRIVLPSALRRSLPAYSNEVIMLLHGTAIVSLVTLTDITGVARHIYSDTYNPLQPFIIAGAMYFMLTWMITRIFLKMEQRWLAFLKPNAMK